MDISVYFDPVDPEIFDFSDPTGRQRFGDIIDTYYQTNRFPELEQVDIAILGVDEDRRAYDNEGCGLAPDFIRKRFYKLFPATGKIKMADLGNIKRGHSIDDTYFAVKMAVSELIRSGIFPVILGGSQDLTIANYQAYENLSQIVNIVNIDSEFDIGETEEDTSSRSFLSSIILQQPNYLFNYTNIGYQTYFVDQDAIRLMKNLFFDIYRLGDVRADLKEVEPMIRNADILSFDISAIRSSDAPGNNNATPNGFYGEEACRIIRYAGLSDKITSLGFYEYNPKFDRGGQTAYLIAQMIWYFVEGYYKRNREYPNRDLQNYIKYIVRVEGQKEGVVFYKSRKSERWWMEVNCTKDKKMKYERHYLIPCSYKDYQVALENDIPDRWWQTYQKLM